VAVSLSLCVCVSCRVVSCRVVSCRVVSCVATGLIAIVHLGGRDRPRVPPADPVPKALALLPLAPAAGHQEQSEQQQEGGQVMAAIDLLLAGLVRLCHGTLSSSTSLPLFVCRVCVCVVCVVPCTSCVRAVCVRSLWSCMSCACVHVVLCVAGLDSGVVVGSTEALLVVPDEAEGQLGGASPDCATLLAVEAPAHLAPQHGVCLLRPLPAASARYHEVLCPVPSLPPPACPPIPIAFIVPLTARPAHLRGGDVVVGGAR